MKVSLRLALVVALVVGCNATASSSPSAGAVPECAAVVPLRAAYADAAGAATAVQDGRAADAATLGTSAKSKAAAVVAGLQAGAGESAPLRAAIEQATTSIGTFADLIASGARAPVSGEEAAAYFTAVGQAIATVEAIATVGWNGASAACPGIEPLAAALPTLVPQPAGTVETQQLAVLADLHLAPAVGVRFDPGTRLAWMPGFVALNNVNLDNATGGPISIPMELTVFGWNGTAWRRLPCQFEDTGDPPSGLCGVSNTNALVLAPGTHTSATDPELFFTLGAIDPGTFALVLPVRRGSDGYPEGAPSEAAIVIVAVTTSP
jgi:hypothetical protein